MPLARTLTLIAPLTELAAGDHIRLTSQPEHVTIVPLFATHADTAQLLAVLARVSLAHGPIEATLAHLATLGRNDDVTAHTLTPDNPFHILHNAGLTGLADLAHTIVEPELAAPYYIPHLLVSPARRDRPGDRFTLRQVALLDASPTVTYPTVLACRNLCGPTAR